MKAIASNIFTPANFAVKWILGIAMVLIIAALCCLVLTLLVSAGCVFIGLLIVAITIGSPIYMFISLKEKAAYIVSRVSKIRQK